MKKRIIAFVTAVLFVIASTVTISAECAIEASSAYVTPRYTYASSASSTLSVSGTTATCKSIANGTSDVTNISVVQTLQKRGLFAIYSDVSGGKWMSSQYGNSFYISNPKYNLDSGTYRLKSEFTFTTSSGATETITAYSDTQTVG